MSHFDTNTDMNRSEEDFQQKFDEMQQIENLNDEEPYEENCCVSDEDEVGIDLEAPSECSFKYCPREKVVVNKTFTDFELREIDRDNAILVDKIMSYSKRPSQYTMPKKEPLKVQSSAAINRKKEQSKIERENLILLKKIQSVKSTGLSRRK